MLELSLIYEDTSFETVRKTIHDLYTDYRYVIVTINSCNADDFVTNLIDLCNIKIETKIKVIKEREQIDLYKKQVFNSIYYLRSNIILNNEDNNNVSTNYKYTPADYQSVINDLLINWSNLICLINTKQIFILINNENSFEDSMKKSIEELMKDSIENSIEVMKKKIITIYMTIYTNEISTTQTNKLIITNKINDIIYMYRNSYIYFHILNWNNSISSNIDLLNKLYTYIKILIKQKGTLQSNYVRENDVRQNALTTNGDVKYNNVVVFMDNISKISYKIEHTQNEILLNMSNKLHHLSHLYSTYNNILNHINYGHMVSNIQHLLTYNIQIYDNPFNSKSEGVVVNVLDEIRANNFKMLESANGKMMLESANEKMMLKSANEEMMLKSANEKPKTNIELGKELEFLQNSYEDEKSNLFGSYTQFIQNDEGVESAAPKESEPEPKVGEYWQNAQNRMMMMSSGVSAPKGKPASKTEEGADDPLSNTQEGAGDPITNGGNSEPTPNASGIAEKDEEGKPKGGIAEKDEEGKPEGEKDEEGKPEGEIAEEFDQTPVTQVNPAPPVNPAPRPPPRPRGTPVSRGNTGTTVKNAPRGMPVTRTNGKIVTPLSRQKPRPRGTPVSRRNTGTTVNNAPRGMPVTRTNGKNVTPLSRQNPRPRGTPVSRGNTGTTVKNSPRTTSRKPVPRGMPVTPLSRQNRALRNHTSRLRT